jgi:magnesium-transporting ATPase (P-type)
MITKSIERITLKVGENEETFDIIKTLEFTPERRMMSVIVRSH